MMAYPYPSFFTQTPGPSARMYRPLSPPSSGSARGSVSGSRSPGQVGPGWSRSDLQPRRDVSQSPSDDEDDNDESRMKLEQKREKNRVKQRNLRLRRANHIQTLESLVSTQKSQLASAAADLTTHQARESALKSWIRDLETALSRHGFSREVEAMRTVCAPPRTTRTNQMDPRAGEKEKGDRKRARTSSGLSALAHAAEQLPPPDPKRRLSSRTTLSPPPFDLGLQMERSHSGTSPRSIRIADLVSPQMDSFTLAPIAMSSERFERGGAVETRRGEVTPSTSSAVARSMGGSGRSSLSEALGSGLAEVDKGLQEVEKYAGPWLSPDPNHDLTHPTLHPSIYTARLLLLSLFPSPLPDPLPKLPNSLTPAQQQIILIALSHLTPPHIADTFRARQLRFLPDSDAKILLEYQSSLHSDPRLVLFPIAILRAKVVRALKNNLPFDVTAFISSTLVNARIFGVPLDPDAWEMPTDYWDMWGGWFIRGREYCHSLSPWRRRGGHRGATVVEMIMGVEERGWRREDAVDKPPSWNF